MIKLYGDKVGIIPIFDPEKSKGGIIIPDEAKERCKQGIVKYVGPLVTRVGIGAYVLFGGYTGQLFQLEGEGKLIIMPEDFILAEIEDEDIWVESLRLPYSMILHEVAEQFTKDQRVIKIKVPRPQAKEYDKLGR